MVRTRPGLEALRSAVSRVDRGGVVTDVVWDWMTRDFGRWSARLVGPRTRAVYGYEYNALELFRSAVERGIPRILEVPSAEHEQMCDMVAQEIARTPALDSPYQRHARAMRFERTARRRAEFALATCVVTNSAHTTESYRRAGLRTDHFHVVSLGAPLPRGTEPSERTAREGLVLAWAGHFSVAKGAHVLLQALGTIPVPGIERIDVYGDMVLPDSVCRSIPAQLRFHGRIAQDQLFARFADADALLHPSLSDGWGQSVSEGLAHGLPVITTSAVGAAGLIVDGHNGRIVEPGHPAALREAMVWLVSQRRQLPAMRAHARATAAARPWSAYRADLASVVAQQVIHG
jgi:glycosyltransferase involved in cell wall biosynthesis